MSMYDPLKRQLSSSDHSKISMTFSEIEAIIQAPLPMSARKHRAWWSNNPSNSVITHAWLKAGFRSAKVNLQEERLVFIREVDSRLGDRPLLGSASIFGVMKGLLSVSPQTDLTSPTHEAWSATED